jgi:hypothetical protein
MYVGVKNWKGVKDVGFLKFHPKIKQQSKFILSRGPIFQISAQGLAKQNKSRHLLCG